MPRKTLSAPSSGAADQVYGADWNNLQVDLAGLGIYKYVIYKDGSNYKAVNRDTGSVDSNSTNARVVIQAAIDAVNSAGGGSIFFRAGTTYTNTDGAIITPKNNVCLIGEENSTTILQNPTIDAGTPPAGVPVKRFGIRNLTLTDNRGGTTPKILVQIRGTRECYFYDLICLRTATVSGFLPEGFFFHFGNWDRNNWGIQFRDNYLAGDTGSQDVVGGGSFYACDFSHNTLAKYSGVGAAENGGQGLAYHESIGSHYDNNTFYNFRGNVIGGEGGALTGAYPCESNTFCNNTIVSCRGGIKLGSENLAADFTRNNVISGNTFVYGQDSGAGIRVGHAVYETITNNKFFRTQYRGIWGSFYGCLISGNSFIDTNYENHFMLTGVPANAKAGGIELYNNANFPADEGENLITNNLFIRTGSAFTVPAKYNTTKTIQTDFIDGGTSQTGETGGIGIQNGYVNNVISGNKFVGLTSTNRINNLGSATIRDNYGYVTENHGVGVIADGGTINHGLVSAPSVVIITPSVSGEFASVTAKGSTTFTVAIKQHDNGGGTTQSINWRCWV